jgi:hypothetical protein
VIPQPSKQYHQKVLDQDWRQVLTAEDVLEPGGIQPLGPSEIIHGLPITGRQDLKEP